MLALLLATACRPAAKSRPTPATCAVVGFSGFAVGEVAIDGGLSEFGPMPASVFDGKVMFAPVGDPTTGTFHVAGYAPVAFSWSAEQACTVTLVPGSTPRIRGVVEVPAGMPEDARIWVEGCSGVAKVVDGAFDMAATAGHCSLRATAYDWRRTWRSSPGSVVVPASGEATPPPLVLEPVGRVGVAVSRTATGLVVAGFPADSAAKAAGILAGDVITSVDGRAVEIDPNGTCGHELSGAVGTVANLGLGDGRTVVVERRLADDSFVKWNPGVRADKVGEGLVVREIGPPAERAGIQVGDVIETVDGKPASSLTEGGFVGSTRAGPPAVFVVARGAEHITFLVNKERFVPDGDCRR